MKPLHEQDEIPELLRKLQAKGDGYRRPGDDYFARMSENVISNEPKLRSLPTTSRHRWILGLAAAAMISLLAVFTFLPPSGTIDSAANNAVETMAATGWEAQIDRLEAGEIEDYIDANIYDFDLELLAEDTDTQN